MVSRWTRKLIMICLLLCIAAGIARAEAFELAFGYEIKLPTDVVITHEEWTPENRALMYLLCGTYHDGQEQFRLRINYGFEHQLQKGEEFAESTNLSIDQVWLWMETTTTLQQSMALGRSSGGEKYDRLINQMSDIGYEAIKSMTNKSMTVSSSNTVPETMDTKQEYLTFGYVIDIPENTIIIQEEWITDDDSLVYRITGKHETEDKLFTGVIFRADENFKNPDKAVEAINHKTDELFGRIKGEFGIMTGFSWIMDDQQETVADQKTEEFLEWFIAFQEIQEDIILAESSKEEKSLPAQSNIFLESYISEITENSEMISIADGRYTIRIEKENDIGVLHHQFMEIDEGNVDGVYYVALDDNETVVDQYTTYQYMPLPEEFPQDIEYMSDEDYLIMMERALNALGEEKAVLLRDLLVKEFHMKNPEIITNEAMKVNHMALREQIQGLSSGGWHTAGFASNESKKERAIRLCSYWEMFDETKTYQRDYLINGIRWLEVNGALIGGYMGGISHCAIFDGALHFARGNFDLTSLTRVEEWEEPKEKESEKSDPAYAKSISDEASDKEQAVIAEDYRIVNTKSSPLTLRKTPENDGTKIALIPKGERVQVLEDGNWPLVKYNGKQGYVNGKYLK